MADVFLSYSRRDSDFVRHLADALEARGKQVWVDTEGIRDGEVFPAALRSAVEGSDGFVFVISPDAVESRFCAQEVDHALELGKRIVPLVHKRVPDDEVPEPIRERNWIPFDDGGFDQSVERLVNALDTDLEHTKAHTRWLVKALEWDAAGRDRSFLVRGAELTSAESWLGEAAGKDPEPTAVQHEYVYASRAAASRRLRILAGAMALALAVSIALAVVALSQRNTARHQSAVASSRELAAVSENQLLIDPELATLIGIQAVRKQPTPQATLALREALDAFDLRETLRGHRDSVTAVAFSPDGKLLASTSPGIADMSVRVWDVRTGRQLRAIYPNGRPRLNAKGPPSAGPPPPGSNGPVGHKPVYLKKGQLPPGAVTGRRLPNYVTFSPDGKQLLVALDSGGIEFYDVATGRLVNKIGAADDHFSRIHFSANGRVALVTGGGPALLADTATSRVIRALPLPGKSDQAFDSDISPDGHFAAVAGPDGYALWNAQTGRLVKHIAAGSGNAVAFSPTGSALAFGGHNGRIALMDPRSGRMLRTIANIAPAGPNRISWSPDGTRLAAALTDGTARIWSATSGQQLERFAGHRCCVIAAAFSPDGRLLATGAEDHKVNVWSSTGNALATVQAARGKVTGLAFAANGDLAITASGRNVAFWKPGGAPHAFPGIGHARGVTVSRDGRMLATSGPGARADLIDSVSGHTVRALHAASPVRAVALDAQGARVALATAHGTHVFSARAGTPVSAQDAPVPVSQVQFVPGRNAMIEALMNVGQEGGGALWLKSLQSGVLLARASSPGPFTAVAVSPTGSPVAAVARADPGIRILDPKLNDVRELLGHVSDVNALAWSSDGDLLASGGADGTVRIWDPATGDELRSIQHGAPVDAVAFNRTGTRLAFGDQSGSVEVWTACPGCADPKTLLALAARAVTRKLSALERRTFLGHQ